ncbi:hypothetical protein OED52_00360 [Rhodococcus sp. Z13]|uniref:Uncharacterized protein n=1 Tax=Rhodococcus sacchari TaxID=2962047 RepID=A0ACD4DM87_9NOCA|nr:hypothetical protein [Rhodococcus sp. Z13]UYP21155.1 hypothetical protein OED52_00360 [Rhodococcus sp. Z13]
MNIAAQAATVEATVAHTFFIIVTAAPNSSRAVPPQELSVRRMTHL